MRNIYRSLLLILAGATQRELARYVRYLKTENEILRSKLPARIVVTPRERNRLIRFAAKLGRGLNELVTIVHPDTLRRWIREERKGRMPPPTKRGRRPTAEQIQRLILKLTKDNGCGCKQRLGGLLKHYYRKAAWKMASRLGKARGRSAPQSWVRFSEYGRCPFVHRFVRSSTANRPRTPGQNMAPVASFLARSVYCPRRSSTKSLSTTSADCRARRSNAAPPKMVRRHRHAVPRDNRRAAGEFVA